MKNQENCRKIEKMLEKSEKNCRKIEKTLKIARNSTASLNITIPCIVCVPPTHSDRHFFSILIVISLLDSPTIRPLGPLLNITLYTQPSSSVQHCCCLTHLRSPQQFCLSNFLFFFSCAFYIFFFLCICVCLASLPKSSNQV